MKRKSLLATAVLALLMVQACRDTGTNESASKTAEVDSAMKADHTTDTSGINRGAGITTFMNEAIIAGLMQIELGKLAVQKATNPEIQKFSKAMVKDYTKINEHLKELADHKRIVLPSALPAADQQHLAELQKMPVNEFENHYMGMMVKEQIKTLDLYKSATTSGDSPTQNLAISNLSTIEGNYKQATDIHNRLELH